MDADLTMLLGFARRRLAVEIRRDGRWTGCLPLYLDHERGKLVALLWDAPRDPYFAWLPDPAGPPSTAPGRPADGGRVIVREYPDEVIVPAVRIPRAVEPQSPIQRAEVAAVAARFGLQVTFDYEAGTRRVAAGWVGTRILGGEDLDRQARRSFRLDRIVGPIRLLDPREPVWSGTEYELRRGAR